MGKPAEISIAIHGAVISPTHDYAIALGGDERAVMIQLSANPVEIVPLDGADHVTNLIALSRTGSSAALYDASAKTVRVFGQLPSALAQLYEIDAAPLSGRMRTMAVSDDGQSVLMGIVGGDGDADALWLGGASGFPRPIASAHVSAVSFLAGRKDAIVADDNTKEAFLILGIDEAASRVPLISSADGIDNVSRVEVTGGGDQAIVIGDTGGSVAIVDLATGRPTLVSCRCQATGLYPLSGTTSFRLNDVSAAPVAVLDISGIEPRIVVIPPSQSGKVPVKPGTQSR
jgi:hypothetical protein